MRTLAVADAFFFSFDFQHFFRMFYIHYIYYEHFYIRNSFKGALSGLEQFLATESSLKMMNALFISPQKALSILKIFNFCTDFLVM